MGKSGGGDVRNVLMVGVGGQGIILASDILSLAAMYAGFDVKKSEIHGMSQRGGSVFSHIRFGEKISSPIICYGETHVLLSLEEMEAVRWLPYLNAETRIILSATRILPAEVPEYPEGILAALGRVFKHLFIVDPKRAVKEIGSEKALNVALLGILSCFIDFPEGAWERAIREEVPQGTFEMNWQTFRKGKTLITEVAS